MTTDYTLVFDKLREVIETETAHVQLLVPNAAAEEVEEMKEIDEIRQVAEELAEPEPLSVHQHLRVINPRSPKKNSLPIRNYLNHRHGSRRARLRARR